MTNAMVLFIIFLGLATGSAIAGSLIMFAMIGEINRMKDPSAQISYMNSSWVSVFREYRVLHPRGLYARAQLFASGLAIVCFLTAFFIVSDWGG